MRLIHYSPKEIDGLKPIEYDQADIKFQSKPNGLWFSVEGDYGWKEWCISEKTFLNRLRFSYEIVLKPEARILILKTPEEIYSFTKKYPLKLREYDADSDTHQLNWNEIKNEYQGIIISPYQWDCRLSMESSWYYGWDCSSGCIWDVNCIEEFIFLGEDLEMPTEPEKRQSLVDIIKKSLVDSAQFLSEDGHKKHEYEFCERTIMSGMQYLKGKRMDKCSSSD